MYGTKMPTLLVDSLAGAHVVDSLTNFLIKIAEQPDSLFSSI